MKFFKAMHNAAKVNAEFYIAEFQVPIDAQPALLTDVIKHAVDDKIAPNAKSSKNAAHTAIRAKKEL